MKNILLLFIGMSICACSNDDNDKNNTVEICNKKNPLEDLSWLKEIKQVFETSLLPIESQIISYKYKGNDVFWIDSCVNCEDALIQIYNCIGEVICQKDGIAGLDDCPDFESEATNKIILWDNVQN